MNRKKEQVKEVIETLLTTTKDSMIFHRSELETAIMKCRGSDKRTLKAWWRYLFALEYFSQPRATIFQLNPVMLRELELEDSRTIPHTPKEKEHTHTNSATEEKKEEESFNPNLSCAKPYRKPNP